VSIEDALNHIDDWRVDWDRELTAAEEELVRKPEWRAGLHFLC
jgi:hypothetical protein